MSKYYSKTVNIKEKDEFYLVLAEEDWQVRKVAMACTFPSLWFLTSEIKTRSKRYINLPSM